MKKLKNYNGLIWLWIAVLIIALDRMTKMLMKDVFLPYTTKKITSFINIVLAYNKGAAFSFLNKAPGWQMWLFGSIAVIVCLSLTNWLSRISAKQIWLCTALNLIIGGALGNLWDRFAYGHVIDFIQLHVGDYYWPVFNVADSAICIGAAMLIAETFFKKKSSVF